MFTLWIIGNALDLFVGQEDSAADGLFMLIIPYLNGAAMAAHSYQWLFRMAGNCFQRFCMFPQKALWNICLCVYMYCSCMSRREDKMSVNERRESLFIAL